MRIERFIASLIAALLGFALPLACFADAQAAPSSWSLMGRYSTSDALGYDGDGFGLAVWRDHCGAKLCLRSELVGTSAEKVDGSSDYAGIVTIEERFSLGDRWWIGAASRWTWADNGEGWSDQFALGAGWSDERADGHGQALHLRLLLPDSTDYETHGYEFRWVSLYPRWLLALELQHVAYTVGDNREWGRRVSLLAGRRWIH